jgi:hypothetical protein
MGVSCQKDLSITVNSPVSLDFYWTMDEAGGAVSRVDKVHALQLFQNGVGQNIIGSPALFNNGLAFIEAGTFSSFDSGFQPQLKIQSSNGFSFFGWFKVLDWPVFPSYSVEKQFRFRNSIGPFVDNTLVWDSFNKHVEITFNDNAFNTYNLTDFVPVTGAWNFFHMFFDPVSTKVGYSINNGANVLGPAGASYAANTNGDITLSQTWAVADSAVNSLLFDEFGVKLSRILTPSEVSFFWNGGAGRTWPF